LFSWKWFVNFTNNFQREGEIALKFLSKENIKNLNENISIDKEQNTTIANIIVDSEGKNRVIITPGANDNLKKEFIENRWSDIKDKKILLIQNETPIEVTHFAFKKAKLEESDIITIFNPAPASKSFPIEMFQYIDYLTPNETEAEILTGINVESFDDAKKASIQLLKLGVKNGFIKY
jgi:ribokinase